MALDTQAKVQQARALANKLVDVSEQRELNAEETATLRDLTVAIREAELRFGRAGVDLNTGGAVERGVEALVPSSATDPAAMQAIQDVSAQAGIPVIEPQTGGAALRAAGSALMERVRQVGDLAQRMILSDEEFAIRAEERIQEQARTQVEEEIAAREAGVPRGAVTTGRVVSDIAPDVAAFGAAGQLTGRAGRIAAETFLSGLDAATRNSLSGEGQLLGATMIGAGLGAGLSPVLELPGKGKDLLMRDVQSAARSRQTRANLAMADDAGIDLSLAEAAERSDISGIEREVPVGPETPRGRFLAGRRQQILDKFDSIERGLNPANMSATSVIKGTKTAYSDALDGLQKTAREEFLETLRPAAEVVGATIDDAGRITGGAQVVPTTELKTELSRQITIARENPGTTPAAIRRMERRLEAIPEQLTLGQTQKMLSDMSADAFGTGKPLVDLERAANRFDEGRLLDSLLDDVDVASRGPALPAAVASSLSTARRQYAARKDEIRAFKETKLDSLLGKVGDPSAEDFAQKVLNLPAEQFRTLMVLAEDANPLLANAIRGRIFIQTANKHMRVSAAGSDLLARKMDVEGFLNDIQGKNAERYLALMGVDTAGQFTTQELKDAHKAIGVLELIARGPNVREEARAAGFTSKLEGAVINAISRNPAFAGRFIAGELGPLYLEKVLFSPEGIRAMAQIGSPAATKAQVTNAVTTLTNMMLANDEQIKAAQDEARAEELARQNAVLERGMRE